MWDDKIRHAFDEYLEHPGTLSCACYCYGIDGAKRSPMLGLMEKLTWKGAINFFARHYLMGLTLNRILILQVVSCNDFRVKHVYVYKIPEIIDMELSFNVRKNSIQLEISTKREQYNFSFPSSYSERNWQNATDMKALLLAHKEEQELLNMELAL